MQALKNEQRTLLVVFSKTTLSVVFEDYWVL